MESVRQLLQDLRGRGQVSGQALRQPSVSELSSICDVTHQTHQSERLTCCCSQSSQRGAHLLWKQLWVPAVQPRGVSTTDGLQVPFFYSVLLFCFFKSNTKTTYVMFKLMNFIVFRKYRLILNLIPGTCFKKVGTAATKSSESGGKLKNTCL